jgi:hypothetical protein
MRGRDACDDSLQEKTMPTRDRHILTTVIFVGFPASLISTLGVPRAHFEILAGCLNALLDGLGMLYDFVSVALGLCTCLTTLIAMKEGDWLPLMALVIGIGFPVVGILLAPFLPHGTLLGASLLVFGVAMAYWLVRPA